MTQREITFFEHDEPRFVANVEALLKDGAARERGLSDCEYAAICRREWQACRTDEIFKDRLLLDECVRPARDGAPPESELREPNEASDEPYCVVLACADPLGNLVGAPEGYSIPDDGVRRAVVRTAASSIPDQEDERPSIATNLIAMFDVLGFEARLRRSGLEVMWALYDDLITEVVRKPNRDAPWLRGFIADDADEPQDVFYRFPVRYAYFSDTIVLWLPYQHPMVLEPFLLRCSAMFCAALRASLPLRGAITVGDSVMHAGSNTFLGAPIVEAARLESAQDWVGVSLGESFNQLARVYPGYGTIAVYDAPRKPGRKQLFSGLVLDWPRFWLEKYGSTAKEALEGLKSPEVARYYDNAISFVAHSFAAREQENRRLSEQGLKIVSGFKP